MLLRPYRCAIHYGWVIIYGKWPLTLFVRLEFRQNHAKVRPELSQWVGASMCSSIPNPHWEVYECCLQGRESKNGVSQMLTVRGPAQRLGRKVLIVLSEGINKLLLIPESGVTGADATGTLGTQNWPSSYLVTPDPQGGWRVCLRLAWRGALYPLQMTQVVTCREV